MRESIVEKRLVTEVKKRGGIAMKFVSPGFDGVPDRIVLFPNGVIAFVEVKALGKKMRPLQVKRKKTLEMLGFPVYCIDNTEMIGGILDEIKIRAIT
ncbi:VRR-NUC domain-containing protein [Clostridium tyrobutyricum]|nr:VRR-NUC domain-containing protein [Clostridium tyrobutyricum]MBV4424314.1 VRR-NUC domain-containing protein [Clostridium tyrobutyricum]